MSSPTPDGSEIEALKQKVSLLEVFPQYGVLEIPAGAGVAVNNFWKAS